MGVRGRWWKNQLDQTLNFYLPMPHPDLRYKEDRSKKKDIVMGRLITQESIIIRKETGLGSIGPVIDEPRKQGADPDGGGEAEWSPAKI